MRLRPVLDGLDFLHGHGKSGQRQLVAEVLDCVSVELTLLRYCIEPIFAELPEDLLDMLLVGSLVLGVDVDVIQVDDDTNIKEISKDHVDKLLECCRGVG